MAKTRMDKAAEVLERAARGPVVDLTFCCVELTGAPSLTPAQRLYLEEYARERYRLWAETWLVPPLRELLARDLEPSRSTRPRDKRTLTMFPRAVPR